MSLTEQPTHAEGVTDDAPKAGWFKRNMRKMVGGFYTLADVIMLGQHLVLKKGFEDELGALDSTAANFDAFKASLTDKRNTQINGMKGMFSWGVGGLVMSLFGNRSIENEKTALEKKLSAYLYDQGVDLDADALQRALKEKNKSVIGHLKDFAYLHPSEIMHASFAYGAIELIKGGVRDKNPAYFGMGASVLTGAMIGMLVKEKTPEQMAHLEPATNIFQKGSRWLQLNANTATSRAYLLNNLFSTYGIYGDIKKYKNFEGNVDHSPAFNNAALFRVGALASYVSGAVVLKSTSKESGHG